MVYSVKQLADLAGVSRRTLHYYDQIGLLRPTSVGKNGYRSYGQEALLRLQQVLFYRELGLELDSIRSILDRPGFDVMEALQEHRRTLQQRIRRLEGLIGTLDKTLRYMKGQTSMGMDELFEGFDEETQQRFEVEAAQLWGEEKVKESRRNWDHYTGERKQAILAEAGEIYRRLADQVDTDPARPEVQELIAAWHRNLRYFYEPNREILLGLAQAYADDPRFAAFFSRLHPGLPAFLGRAIEHYCRNLPAG
ncbi:MAG: MerR family transcriptional regulator [Chloroflexi bacterium]|nr:MerR family transcriptional regulator [Chloroflexota bacterium]